MFVPAALHETTATESQERDLHQGGECWSFQIFWRLRFQKERNFSAPTKGITSRIAINLESGIICWRTKNMLSWLGIRSRLRRDWSDMNAICNKETAIKSETKSANKVATSQTLRSFSPSQEFRGSRLRQSTLIYDFRGKFHWWRNRLTRFEMSSSGDMPIPVSSLGKMNNTSFNQ